LEISLPGHCFRMSDPVNTSSFYCLLLLLFLKIWCFVSGLCFEGQHFALSNCEVHWVHLGVAPELRVDFCRQSTRRSSLQVFSEITFIFHSCFFSGQTCLSFALCFRGQHFASSGMMIHWVPNGCSPRASSGFLKIIYSKVFISCFFCESSFSFVECLRGQHYVINIMLQRSTYIFVFEAEYTICPYLARSGNLFDLRLIGRSIDGS
jgi:hypothetical protein